MPGEVILAGFLILLFITYLLFGVLALRRCKRKDIRKVLRTLIRRSKR